MAPLILLVLSSITHFLFFGHPSAVVFDEVYNGSFVSSYSTGSYYFDIHPPLAKLITKFFGDLIGAPYNIDFGAIGNTLPWGVVLLRLLPIIAGILLPTIIYYICRRLNFSKITSFAAGALIILENSLLTQSRFLLFDGVMLLFGFSSILLYLIYTKNESKKYLLVLSAFLAATAFSIKWTGLAYPLLLLIAEIVRIQVIRTRKVKEIGKFLGIYALAGLIVYLSVFAIHFKYLTHSGPGDAFMSDRFQKTLVGNSHASDASLKPKGFFGKFLELNVEMYQANKTLTAKHPYSSPWYTWPLMIRSIFYWQGTPDAAGVNSYIYLLGNPVIYWLGFGSILLLLWRILEKRKEWHKNKTILFILTGFLVNFLPFMFIGRVMFLYHYEAALVFCIIAFCYLLERSMPKKLRIWAVSSVLLVSLITFVFFSPLTYGTSLTKDQLQSRMWLSTWR